jgi:calcium-binding protein CML
MSQIRMLNFKYNLTKFRSGRERQFSDFGEPNYEPDREEMELVFYKIAGADKKIKLKELTELLTKVGVANAADEAEQMINTIGSKKDKAIDLECFLDMHKNGVKMREIRRAFSVFDRDKDGRLSTNDIQHMFSMLGEPHELEDCERIVRAVGRNQNKYVDMDDFMVMMTWPAKKSKL